MDGRLGHLAGGTTAGRCLGQSAWVLASLLRAGDSVGGARVEEASSAADGTVTLALDGGEQVVVTAPSPG